MKICFCNCFFLSYNYSQLNVYDFSTFYSFRIHGFYTLKTTQAKPKNPCNTTVFEVFHTFHGNEEYYYDNII